MTSTNTDICANLQYLSYVLRSVNKIKTEIIQTTPIVPRINYAYQWNLLAPPRRNISQELSGDPLLEALCISGMEVGQEGTAIEITN